MAISSYDWIINIIFHYNFFSSAGQAVGRSIGEASSWLLRVLRRGCGQHSRHHNLGDWELLPQSGKSSVNSYRFLLLIFYCCLVNIRVVRLQFYLKITNDIDQRSTAGCELFPTKVSKKIVRSILQLLFKKRIFYSLQKMFLLAGRFLMFLQGKCTEIF